MQTLSQPVTSRRQASPHPHFVPLTTINRITRALKDPRAGVLEYLTKQYPRPCTRKEIFRNMTDEPQRTIADHLRSLYLAQVIGKFQIGREVVYYLNF